MFFNFLNKVFNVLKKDGVWVIFSRLLIFSSGFITVTLLPNIFSENDYGFYKYLRSIMGLFLIFTLPESANIVSRFSQKFNFDLVSFFTKKRILFGLASLPLISPFFFYSHQISVLISVFLFLAFILFFSSDLYIPFLQGNGFIKRLNLYLGIRVILNLLVVIIISFLTKDPLITFISSISTFILYNISIYFFVKKKILYNRIRFTPRKKLLLLKQSKILTFYSILPILVLNLDSFLIGFSLSMKELAEYSIGLVIGKSFGSFLKAFIPSYFNILINKKIHSIYYLYIFLIFSLTGLILSLLFIPIIFDLFYENQFPNARFISQIITLSLGIYMLKEVYYKKSILHKNSSIKSLLNSLKIIPFSIVIMQLFVVFFLPNKLISLAILFPINNLLTILIIYSYSRK